MNSRVNLLYCLLLFCRLLLMSRSWVLYCLTLLSGRVISLLLTTDRMHAL